MPEDAMPFIDLTCAQWRKAARSAQENGGCVEIAINLPGITAIRDSKDPGNGAHVVPDEAFAIFLAAAKAGRYDG